MREPPSQTDPSTTEQAILSMLQVHSLRRAGIPEASGSPRFRDKQAAAGLRESAGTRRARKGR